MRDAGYFHTPLVVPVGPGCLPVRPQVSESAVCSEQGKCHSDARLGARTWSWTHPLRCPLERFWAPGSLVWTCLKLTPPPSMGELQNDDRIWWPWNWGPWRVPPALELRDAVCGVQPRCVVRRTREEEIEIAELRPLQTISNQFTSACGNQVKNEAEVVLMKNTAQQTTIDQSCTNNHVFPNAA